MNINRHNYEEWFLLYVDGELNASQLQEVEAFVALHTDLAAELQMLRSTVMPMDAPLMPGKDKLLKRVEWDAENISQTQQQLLLHLDGELSNTEAQDLEAQLQLDMQLQQEHEYLQHSVLATEKITMPGRQHLYKHANDRKPAPLFWIKRWAVAAGIAGLGWFLLNGIISTPTGEQQMATTTGASATGTKPALHSIGTTNAAKQTMPANGAVDAVAGTVERKNSVEKSSAQHISDLAANNRTELLVEDAPRPGVSELIVNATENDSRIQETQAPQHIAAATVTSLTAIHEAAHAETNLPALAYTDEPMDSEEEYINIGGAHIKKQKLRGVFRTVTRTLSRGIEKGALAVANVNPYSKNQ